jgi:hypothetical protein
VDRVPQSVLRWQFVYIITDGEFCKIGRSFAPERRRKQLQSGYPRELKLLFGYRVADAIRIEADLHRAFSTQHARYEWFTLSQYDIGWVENVLRNFSQRDLDREIAGQIVAVQ